MSEDISKYRTFLKRTHRQVRRPATDHDKAQIGAGQTALLDRIDELKALKKCVTNAIRSRVDILEAEERELRKLSKLKEKIAYVEADVYVDSRQGGVIVVLDAETGDVLKGPMPLSASQREVFASTKSQPGLFGDPVAVNEELARKLALTDFLAEEKPITIDERVRNALDAGDLPEETKNAILALEEDDGEERPKAKKDKPPKEPKESKKGKKKDKGSAPTLVTPPAPSTPVTTVTTPTDDEPGPPAIEPDREELPKHPPRARPDLSDTPPGEEEPSIGDVVDAEGMAGDVGETHAPEATADDDDSIPEIESEDESPRAREYDASDEAAAEMLDAAAADTADAAIDDDIADTAPDSSDAPGEPIDDVDVSEHSEPVDVPPDAEIVTDAIPEMDDAPTEPASVEMPAEPAPEPVTTPAAEPAADTSEPAVETPAEPAKPAEVAPPAAVTPKKRDTTKKRNTVVDPPEPDAQAATPPPPVAAPDPAPTAPAAPELTIANHFGLKTEKMAADALGAFKSMLRRTVFFSPNLADDVEKEAKTKFGAVMKTAVRPIFEHLAADKQISKRKLANGDVAYYDAPTIAKSQKDLTPEKVEAAIALHLKK